MFRLISFVGVDDSDILPHFLGHYRRLGVGEFQLLLHGEWTEAELRPCRAADVVVARRVGESYSDVVRTDAIEAMARQFVGEWVVLADADEFLELPYATLDRTVAVLRCLGIEELPCSLLQRATADGTLPALSEAPIDEQFPCYDHLLAERMIPPPPIWKSKYPLAFVGARFSNARGNHLPHAGSPSAHMPIRGVVHHFKWRGRLLRSLLRERGARSNQREQEGYRRWLETNDFRLPTAGLQGYSREAMWRAGFLVKPTAVQLRVKAAVRRLRRPGPAPAVQRSVAALRETGSAWPQEDHRARTCLDRAALAAAPGRIAILTNDFAGMYKSAGVGTAMGALAEQLVAAGHDVHAFYCPIGPTPPEASQIEVWQRRGVNVHVLSRYRNGALIWPDELVLWFSQVLGQHEWDVIHFHDIGGYAAATLLERAARLRHQHAQIVVAMHGPTPWTRFANHLPWTRDEALRTELERTSVQLADVVLCPSRYILNWCREHYPSDACHVLVPNSLTGPSRGFAAHSAERKPVNEIVYFGRVEVRKGIETFLGAIQGMLDAGLTGFKVVLLGPIGKTYSLRKILARTEDWPCRVQVITEYSNHEAIDYLKSNNCIAVIPSEIDNAPYTVYECLDNGIPLLASDACGIPELVHEADRPRVLVSGGAAVYAERLAEAVRFGVAPARLAFDADTAALDLLALHANLVTRARQSRSRLAGPKALDTAVIVYGDDRETSRALSAMVERWMRAGCEVLAGAEPPEPPVRLTALSSWADAAACNRLAASASRNHLLLCHSSVSPAEGALEALICALKNAHADAAVCGFRAVRPRGGVYDVPVFAGPRELSASDDVYGAPFFLVRRQAWLDLGGFDEEPDLSPILHWEFLNRLRASGRRIVAVPPALVRVDASAPLQLTESQVTRLAAPWVASAPAELRGLVRKALGASNGRSESGKERGAGDMPPIRRGQSDVAAEQVAFVVETAADAFGCDLLVKDDLLRIDELSALIEAGEQHSRAIVASDRESCSDYRAKADDRTEAVIGRVANRIAAELRAFFGIAGEVAGDVPKIVAISSDAAPAEPQPNPEQLLTEPLRPDLACELLLSDDFVGGELTFTSLDMAVRPARGRLVAWTGSPHHTCFVRPVVSGTRVAVRFGFRLKVAGRMPDRLGDHPDAEVATAGSLRPPRVEPLRTAAPAAPVDVFVGLHVPKCAGTTLLRNVESCVPKDCVHQSTSFRTAFLEGQPPFLALQRYDRLRFVFGHSVHQEMIKRLPRAPILFTGLRDPLERLRSVVGWERELRRHGYAGACLENNMTAVNNPMCRFIVRRFPQLAGEEGTLADQAMRALEAFSLCYFPDTFEACAAAIFAQLGIRPLRIDHRVASQPLPEIDVDRAALRYDFELYARARERFAGPLPPRLAPTELARQLHGEPERTDVLRGFLHNEYRREYQSWGMLEEVARWRRDQADELWSEAAMLAGEGN